MANLQGNCLPSVGKGGVILATGLAVLSVASVALPVINIKVMGFGGGLALASPHFLGGVAYLLPLAFLAGLVARFAPQAQTYVRVLEIAGLVIAVGIALYATMTLLNGMNEMSNADRQMAQMLGSANARQLSSMRGLSLAGGTLALVLLLLGSAWQVWSGRRR
ncbi:hypothetical protein DFR48_10736 [Ciceribacter lividus]|uniref:Uncharacterized protein n=1 Tax=Ciceribacter lividus TaxID=1197950 RepID=A0A6I7HJQ8_9HYPH|nr:hypothetical protein [Ciceribacter lividus]RCW23167.1 hypothetical protein DFR48_10736 [Ciceribacter lividus]